MKSKFRISIWLPAIALTLLTLGSAPLRAQSCSAVVQPHLDWMRQGSSDEKYPVYGTVTAHWPSTPGIPSSFGGDLVEYANGRAFSNDGASLTFEGPLLTAPNDPPFKQNQGFSFTMRVTVDMEGNVTFQKLYNGQPFMGKAPRTFSASCQNNLITAFYDGAEYTLGFTDAPPYANLH